MERQDKASAHAIEAVHDKCRVLQTHYEIAAKRLGEVIAERDEAVALLRAQNTLASTLYDALAAAYKALGQYADGPATPRELNAQRIVRAALDTGEVKGRNADAFLSRLDARKGGAE